jgi:hypothetical protein
VEKSARHLGIGLVNVVNAYGPGRIIIGDEMSRFGEKYLDAVKVAVAERLNPRVRKSLRIELETSEDDEILSGVGVLAVGHILRQGFVPARGLKGGFTSGEEGGDAGFETRSHSTEPGGISQVEVITPI